MCCMQEYVNGQLKNKYGDVFIRGNNGEWCTALACLYLQSSTIVSLALDLAPAAPPPNRYHSCKPIPSKRATHRGLIHGQACLTAPGAGKFL
jgi:hypothetical protein